MSKRKNNGVLRVSDFQPRSINQKKYLESIEKNDITFCVGPAGTGKTLVSIYVACNLLREEKIRRIILCRPAVQSGEDLGFLPGDLREKVDPYLRPLFDSLYKFLGRDIARGMLREGIIEIIPFAFMRGVTFENAIIILDEAQNTTSAQMKMFLTRMGSDSKMVINGDITQIDLCKWQSSGLSEARRLLNNVKGIGWIRMTSKDVQRHPLVQKIINVYDWDEAEV